MDATPQRAPRPLGLLAEIVDDLAKTFNAPRDRIEADVTAMLTGLVDKRLMEI